MAIPATNHAPNTHICQSGKRSYMQGITIANVAIITNGFNVSHMYSPPTKESRCILSEQEKTVISQQLYDLKEFFGFRLDQLELKVDGKCENCPTSVAFRERSRSQWTHIKALWTTLATIAGYFYYHLR